MLASMRTTLLALSIAAPLLAAPPAPAGDKEPPLDTSYLRTYAETRGFSLGRPAKARPTPDGKAVLFLRSPARVPKLRLYEFDVATGATRELLTPEMVLKGAEERLSPEEKARRERQRVSVGGFTDFHLSDDGRRILVSLSGKLYVVERATGAAHALNTGAGTIVDPKFAPGGNAVGYVRGHDLYVLDLASNKEKAVTAGGTVERTHALAEFVAQEEMGRFTGYWWSPDAKFVAYEDADAAGVEVWYVADPIHPDRAPTPFFYPRPGKANVKVRLGVVPVAGGETVWVKWDAGKYPYLADVRWDKRGPLTLVVQTRLQDELLLLRADPATGETTPLLTEKDPAWVNLRHDGPRWLADGSFLWVGEHAKGLQLEHRNANGSLKGVLVGPEAGHLGLLDVDPEAGTFVFRAGTDPTRDQVFRQKIGGGHAEPLTHGDGQHAAAFGDNHAVWVCHESPADGMPRSTVRKADGSVLGDLPSVAEDPPFKPRAEIVKVGEGEGFYASLVRPRDFSPARRYPVVVHVYGGPTHQQVTAAMNTRLLDQWIADQGFVVVAVDNRGTPGRGRDWERAVSRKFGSVPLEGQVAGLRALGAKYPELDLNRVGIYGWSFGGYMSALAVLRRPDVYKAAVAGAPVADWFDYDTHYTERYLGLPQTDAAAYKEADLLTYAGALERPLLLVHGTADDNVYFRHTLKLTDALFRAGKDFEVLPLSGLTHMVPDPVVTQRLYARIAGHFRKHLGLPAEAGAAR
jgi:dipeptidyl-peptidase-4